MFTTLDTFSNCHKPVFSLGVCQQYYSQNNKPVNILNSTGRPSIGIIIEEKTPLSYEAGCFPDTWIWDLKSNSDVSK